MKDCEGQAALLWASREGRVEEARELLTRRGRVW